MYLIISQIIKQISKLICHNTKEQIYACILSSPEERVHIICTKSIKGIEYLNKLDKANTACSIKSLLLETSNHEYSRIKGSIAKLFSIYICEILSFHKAINHRVSMESRDVIILSKYYF